jgi:hypothetical protein
MPKVANIAANSHEIKTYERSNLHDGGYKDEGMVMLMEIQRLWGF